MYDLFVAGRRLRGEGVSFELPIILPYERLCVSIYNRIIFPIKELCGTAGEGKTMTYVILLIISIALIMTIAILSLCGKKEYRLKIYILLGKLVVAACAFYLIAVLAYCGTETNYKNAPTVTPSPPPAVSSTKG